MGARLGHQPGTGSNASLFLLLLGSGAHVRAALEAGVTDQLSVGKKQEQLLPCGHGSPTGRTEEVSGP